jgi:hypothetical protein
MIRQSIFVCFLCLFTLNAVSKLNAQELYDPLAIYLTWQQDPTTTMTIDWHDIDTNRDVSVEYRELSSSNWVSQTGSKSPFPFSKRTIFRTELTNLSPNTLYEFRFGTDSKIYRFRTMPTDASEPIRIAFGGDTMHRPDWMIKVAKEAQKFDPHFAVIGGDMAYEDARAPELQNFRDSTMERSNLMYHWFSAYKEGFTMPDGRIIPMLVSTGNHEVYTGYYYNAESQPQLGAYEQTYAYRSRMAPYFFATFAMPGHPGYNVLDFGQYLSIVMLDTDHVNPIEGRQTEWLEGVLASRTETPHVFPVYHVPAYPSVRDMNDRVQTNARTHWVPLFEKYGIRFAFENHDHAYKRTYPIRDGKISADGVIYLGDGAWGTETREISSRQNHEAWYLEEAHAQRHFILVTIHNNNTDVIAVNEDGEIIDQLLQSEQD